MNRKHLLFVHPLSRLAQAMPAMASWTGMAVLVAPLVLVLWASGATNSSVAPISPAGASTRDETAAPTAFEQALDQQVKPSGASPESELPGESDERFERGGGSQY